MVFLQGYRFPPPLPLRARFFHDELTAKLEAWRTVCTL